MSLYTIDPHFISLSDEKCNAAWMGFDISSVKALLKHADIVQGVDCLVDSFALFHISSYPYRKPGMERLLSLFFLLQFVFTDRLEMPLKPALSETAVPLIQPEEGLFTDILSTSLCCQLDKYVCINSL